MEEHFHKAQDDDLQSNPEEILKNPQEINNKLCCPAIAPVSMKMTIVHCSHITEVTENNVSKCPDCNHTINVSKWEKKFEGSLEVQMDNISIDIKYP